jgi:hypothetical protein
MHLTGIYDDQCHILDDHRLCVPARDLTLAAEHIGDPLAYCIGGRDHRQRGRAPIVVLERDHLPPETCANG